MTRTGTAPISLKQRHVSHQPCAEPLVCHEPCFLLPLRCRSVRWSAVGPGGGVRGRSAALSATGMELAIARVLPRNRDHVRRPPWSAPALRGAHRASTSASTAAKRRVGVALYPLCGFRPSVPLPSVASGGPHGLPARRVRGLAPRCRGVGPPAARLHRCVPLLGCRFTRSVASTSAAATTPSRKAGFHATGGVRSGVGFLESPRVSQFRVAAWDEEFRFGEQTLCHRLARRLKVRSASPCCGCSDRLRSLELFGPPPFVPASAGSDNV